MAELTSTTLHYLMAGKDYFWRWEEDGDVICWRNGTTIVFRDELCELLEPLAGQGLPPFGAILITLAACRPAWNAHSAEAGILQGVGMLAGGVPDGDLNLGVRNVLRRLDVVANLPEPLRHGLAAKATLLALLFDSTAERFSRRESRHVLDALRREHLDETLVGQIDRVPVLYRLTGDLRALREALRNLDSESLARRLRTSLDRLPIPTQPATDQLPELAGDSLFDQLSADAATAGLARLGRHMAAILRLPRQQNRGGQLPLDGFVDIANRGSLDRLLVSELAMDDLTLAVRLANHEALFLRREATPEPCRRRRRILLDHGIRMWGTPRIVALSAALGILDRHRDAELLVHHDGHFSPISLHTVQQVQQELERLEPAPHPAIALQRLLAVTDGVQRDDILITHRAVLKDPEFERIWRELGESRPGALLAIGNRGELQLHAVSSQGLHSLLEAKLDLQRLLGDPAAPVMPAESIVAGDVQLPVILSCQPFPLLLPATLATGGEPGACLPDLGIVGVTRDRRLMHWPPNTSRYGRQLLDTVPPADRYWVSLGEEGQIAVVAATDISDSEQETRLLVTDLNARVRELYSLGIATEPVRFVHRSHDWMLIFSDHSVHAVDPASGRIKYRYIYSPGEEYWQGPFLKRGLDTILVLIHSQAIWHEVVPDDFAIGDLVHPYDPAHFDALPRQAACLLPAVEGIGISSSGQLTLIQEDGRRWSLRFGAHSLRWTLNATESAERLSRHLALKPTPAPPGVGYKLRNAVWRDGSAAFVDSRGLLHLKSAQAALPEVTIVLVTDQPAACWASDGTCCGPAGYHGRTGIPARDFHHKISLFMNGLP